jgi:hypothetical protein
MTPLAIPGAFIIAAAAVLLFLAIRESRHRKHRLRVRIGDAHSNRLANAQDVDWSADAETPVNDAACRLHCVTRASDGSLSVKPWPPEAA